MFDVAESSYIEYSSSDTRVATVDQYGLVTAMGIGEATVRATYRKGAETRSMEFSVQLDSLDLTATPNALDFGSHAVGAPSAHCATPPLPIVSAVLWQIAVHGSYAGPPLLPVAAFVFPHVYFPALVGGLWAVRPRNRVAAIGPE